MSFKQENVLGALYLALLTALVRPTLVLIQSNIFSRYVRGSFLLTNAKDALLLSSSMSIHKYYASRTDRLLLYIIGERDTYGFVKGNSTPHPTIIFSSLPRDLPTFKCLFDMRSRERFHMFPYLKHHRKPSIHIYILNLRPNIDSEITGQWNVEVELSTPYKMKLKSNGSSAWT